MSRALPSPIGMYFRLVSGAASVAVVVGAAVVPLTWLAAPAMSIVQRDLPWLALLLLANMIVVAMVAAVVVVRRIRPLHRALVRSADEDDAERPPPSEAALRDAFEGPRWMARVTGVFLVVVIGLHAAGSEAFPGLLSSQRLFFDLMACATLALGILPAALLWRRSLWMWLGHIDPTDVPPLRRGSVADRLVFAVTLPLSSVALASLAVLVAQAEAEKGGLGASAELLAVTTVGLLLVGVACAAVVHRFGRGLGRELNTLADGVSRALERPTPVEISSATGGPPHTREVEQLARRLDALAGRYADSLAEEARARRAIEQVQELKTRFMAYMSHDLRSPLNSIKGFAEVMARETDGPLNEAQRESVEMIRDSGDALLRLVNDILDSAKLEAGRLDIRQGWTPSVEIVTEAARQARSLVGRRAIQIATELEPGLPPVHVDRDRIVQALVGILSHVLRSAQPGTIRLRARVLSRPEDGRPSLRLEVVDESASPAAESRQPLFEAFRAMRGPTGRRIGGLGLGLSLAKSLVAAHGGDVWYEPAGGRGTCFCISLPLS